MMEVYLNTPRSADYYTPGSRRWYLSWYSFRAETTSSTEYIFLITIRAYDIWATLNGSGIDRRYLRLGWDTIGFKLVVGTLFCCGVIIDSELYKAISLPPCRAIGFARWGGGDGWEPVTFSFHLLLLLLLWRFLYRLNFFSFPFPVFVCFWYTPAKSL